MSAADKSSRVRSRSRATPEAKAERESAIPFLLKRGVSQILQFGWQRRRVFHALAAGAATAAPSPTERELAVNGRVSKNEPVPAHPSCPSFSRDEAIMANR